MKQCLSGERRKSANFSFIIYDLKCLFFDLAIIWNAFLFFNTFCEAA